MELANFSFETLLFLFTIAIIAGFLDTLAGGGGLITMPALIIGGVPPLAALGTNKLQGSMGTATATFIMLKKKKITWIAIKPLMITAFIGAVLGTLVVQLINTEILSFVIPIVLLFIAIYFLLAPTPKEAQSTAQMSEKKYKNIVIPSIGFYDGMFGPGTGSFFALAGISCSGHGLINATAIAKSLNFSTNIASLIVFLMVGQVILLIGLLMMLGQLIGAWLGAHSLFKIKPSYLKGLVVFMCFGMLIKYTYSMGWLNFIQ